MKFGPVPIDQAEGAILAHSLALPNGSMRKGTKLAKPELTRLKDAGIGSVTVAQLADSDIGEDEAASCIGAKLVGPGMSLGPVFTGRINIEAALPGVVSFDLDAISAFNGINEGLTLATLPNMARVSTGQLIATVKIIPYGIPKTIVSRGIAALGSGAMVLHPFGSKRAQLIMTRTHGFKESLLTKGERIVRDRVEALGYVLGAVDIVAHDELQIARAFDVSADLILILGASATSDRSDVAPAAVVRAGGKIDRFGMPVDPGNLLFLGSLGERPVVGLPGCARSPALNGVDWVLERIAAGIAIDGNAIAEMAVGGLLKEMQGRPQPRQPKS